VVRPQVFQAETYFWAWPIAETELDSLPASSYGPQQRSHMVSHVGSSDQVPAHGRVSENSLCVRNCG
jgi:hypothetical protein